MFEQHGFHLIKTEFLHMQASYLICGAIRKLFNKKNRMEGETVGKLSHVLELIVLPITKLLDKIIPGRRDVAML